MTALARIFSRLRHPHAPAPDWWGPACTCPTCVPRDWIDWLGNGLPTTTRYDAEWPSVLAAEVDPSRMAAEDAALATLDREGLLGGDLAAMAAPLPGMARDDLGTYAVPVVHIEADVTEFREAMESIARTVGLATVAIDATQRARADLQDAWTKPARPVPADPPRGRHRQTDPHDLILADLRDLGGGTNG